VFSIHRGLFVALVAGATIVVAVLVQHDLSLKEPRAHTSTMPPMASGYFATRAAGNWSHLPDDQECASRIHRSSWEPRPDNRAPNARMPNADEVHTALARRPRARLGAYDPRWDTWLLPRVTGHHAGTTDENIQWAACKWGMADNLLRAIAFRESSWFQYEIYPDGRCVLQHGCGDMVGSPTPASRAYCSELSGRGHDYTADFGAGVCPRTFSIVGVMSWQDPSWGQMDGNQNGTFPFNRDGTAFALDYLGAVLRGCQEGWMHWLGARGAPYGPGRIWGCVGAWYTGAWWSGDARRYVALVRSAEHERPWLDPNWAELRLNCSADFGCPLGSP
jgi:hypothetical protein